MKTTRSFPLSVLLLPFLSSCATTARVSVDPREAGPPRRLALAVAEPRRMVTVDAVHLSVRDSGPPPSATAAGPSAHPAAPPSGHRGVPTIVCLHAIGHGGGDFLAFERAFAGRYRVVSVDWPGHGASGPDRQPASAARYAALLPGILDALGIERAVLFGNSIGGAAAVAFAARAPERVSALVLANPGGLDPGGWLPRLFISYLVSRFRQGAEGREAFAAWYERYYGDILITPEASARRAEIVAAGYESAPLLVEAWSSFARPEASLRALLPGLRMPVFVAWAMKDGLIRWSRNRAAVQSIPMATVVRFERSAHAAFLEEPERFHATLAPFLGALR